MLPFKANYRQDPRMGFEGRKKGKYAGAEKFVEKMKKIQEEAKVALSKVQEEIKKYMDRKRGEVDDYKVGDLVILSTKDLKYQMVGRRIEKLMEKFVGPYKVKKIVLSNVMELELPSAIKIHLAVNVSRIYKYIGQVEGQKKEQLAPVIIKGEEEQEVKRILNKQQIRERDSQWNPILGKEERTWKMKKKQSKSLRKNINEIQKMWQDKNMRKKYSRGKNCQEDLQQENCSVGQIKGMIKNTGEDQKETGDSGKKEENNKQQKQSKKKKFRKKIQE